MHVRLALESDLDQLIDMAREAVEENRPWLAFDEDTTRQTFWSYISTADPTIFVVDSGGALSGMTLATIQGYRMASGLFTVQEVLFVRPGSRGSRAAALLTKEIVAWSQMLGAKEIVSGNDSATKSDHIARFLTRFGFENVGYAMRRVL